MHWPWYNINNKRTYCSEARWLLSLPLPAVAAECVWLLHRWETVATIQSVSASVCPGCSCVCVESHIQNPSLQVYRRKQKIEGKDRWPLLPDYRHIHRERNLYFTTTQDPNHTWFKAVVVKCFQVADHFNIKRKIADHLTPSTCKNPRLLSITAM